MKSPRCSQRGKKEASASEETRWRKLKKVDKGTEGKSKETKRTPPSAILCKGKKKKKKGEKKERKKERKKEKDWIQIRPKV
jgi:hypothetical protein